MPFILQVYAWMLLLGAILIAINAIVRAGSGATLADSLHGPVQPRLECPHCKTTGAVRAIRERQKTGVSGGKATAAVLTGGLSLLATGLSKKQDVTVCRCDHCRMTWTVS